MLIVLKVCRIAPGQGDHVFNKLNQALGKLANVLDDYGAWPELSEALRNARALAESNPFELKVMKGVREAIGDINSRIFGEALDGMRAQINNYLEAGSTIGETAARQQQAGPLLSAWNTLIDSATDTEAATLVAAGSQNLLREGQRLLQQIRYSVAAVIGGG